MFQDINSLFLLQIRFINKVLKNSKYIIIFYAILHENF